MDAVNIWRFFGLSLFPFVAAIILHLLFKFTNPLAYKKPEYLPPSKGVWFYKGIIYPFKKFLYIITNTKKGFYWYRQVMIGLYFVGIAIASYYLGIDIPVEGNPLVKTPVFTVSNLTVAPIIAGLIFGWPAGLICGIGGGLFRGLTPGFLQYPTMVALFASGATSALISHFIFEDERPSWYFCILGGIFIETFNMILIFLFNIYYVNEAYELLRLFDFISIGFAALSTSLTSLTIALIEKERIFPKRKDRNNISNRVSTWLFTMCVIGLVVMGVTVRGVAESKSIEDYSKIAISSVNDISQEISSVQAFLPLTDTKTLELFVGFLQKTPEHHHVTPKGFTVTVATNHLEKICDDSGVEKGYRVKNNQIIGAPAGYPLKPGQELKINGEYHMVDLHDFRNSASYCYVNGIRYLASFNYDKIQIQTSPLCYVVVFIPDEEVQANASIVFRVASYIDIMVFILLFTLASYVLNRKIIYRIQLMDKSLEKIMDGNLNEELHIEGYNEFTNLSNNINLAVGALKNYAEEVELRINNELQFAHDIQIGSVPTAFPVEKNYNIHAIMTTAKEVGGDFYDYFKMNNGRILFLVADVSGKGIPAAMFMMRARTLIKSLSSTDIPLSDIVNTANKDLCTQNESGIFVTAWIGILDPNTGELRYVNAGHTTPLIKRNGKFEEFTNNHNVVLAALPDYEYKTEITYLEPGDEILLYTDGVTEAQNAKKELYGTKRLLDFVNDAKYFNAKQLLNEISDDVVKYAEGEEQFDDMTVLMMRYLGNITNEIPETAITLKSRPSNASIAVNFVESILTKNELSMKLISQISIVVDELFANIAFYAYPQNHIGEATIQVDIRDDYLFLTFIDSGKPFDPTAPRKTNLSSDINERKKGGLGIYIVKNTMDELRYEYVDNRNVLHLMKKIK